MLTLLQALKGRKRTRSVPAESRGEPARDRREAWRQQATHVHGEARFTLQGKVTCGRPSMTALSARGQGQWARAFTSGRSETRKNSGHSESEGQALRPLPASLFLYDHRVVSREARAGADVASSQRGHEILRSRLRPSPPGPHTSCPGPAPQVSRFARDDRQHSPCPLALEPKGRRQPGARARRRRPAYWRTPHGCAVRLTDSACGGRWSGPSQP